MHDGVSDRVAMEAALERARRTLLVLTRCNEAILRASTEEQLFADVCRVIVEVGGYRMCWVGVAEQDERRTVRPVAWAGHEDGYLRAIDVSWADVPHGRGPTGTAAREGRVVMGEDFASQPSLAPWREEALRRGYASATALPIAYDGERVGVLTMYSSDVRAFSDDDLGLLQRLAEDIGFGAVSLRRRAEKERVERQLVESSQSLRAVFDLCPDAAMLSRARDGVILDVNDTFTSLTGWVREEALGRSSFELGVLAEPIDRERVTGLLEKSGVVRNLDARLRTRSGAALDTLLSARVLTIGGEPVILTLIRDMTEVNRSARRYRLLAENVQDVIWTLDLESLRFSYVSPAVRRLRGLTVEQALAEPFEESMTVESLARIASIVSGRNPPGEDGGSFTGIFDQPCADGSVKHVEITTSYVRNEEGRPVEILGVSRDATSRVLAERKLRESSERLATLVRVARVGFLVTRVSDRRIVDVNEAWCEQLGWTRDEALGRTTAELGLHIDREQRDRFYAGAWGRGEMATIEVRLRRRSGEEAEFLITGDRAEIGGQDCMIAAWHDVTALRRADAALRANEARFRTLIERSSDLILLLDAEGAVAFWSPGAVGSLGWTGDEVIGQPFLARVQAEDRLRISEALGRLLAGVAETEAVAFRMERKGGGTRIIEGLCRNLLDDPAIGALVMNLRDVTEHQRLEEHVRQAQRLESIGRLAGGVAHDFNNLLTVILSCSETMQQASGTGRPIDREDLTGVHEAASRARDLTRQLLAFARRQVIEPVPIDLNRIIGGSEKLLRRVLGEDVELRMHLTPGIWTTVADPTQIEQVLVNLAVNARDAMPGGGTLTVETRNVPDTPDGCRPGDWVRVLVRDTGTGMSPEVIAHIFEPFFTTKEQGRGTGLGLATVHGIVAQAGGHIHVESEPGHGATFLVCMPRVDQPVTVRTTPLASGTVEGGETILVVEDDAQVRSVTVRALAGHGYAVFAAGSGEEALAVVRARRGAIDLVVTDVVMPGMSGREVVDELRRTSPGLRALYVSGYTRDVIARRGGPDSGVEFLPKPFTSALLLARVRAVLDAGPPPAAG